MNQDHHPQYLSPSPSDLDSQSDSDWLDIVSSRESDDNDSVPSDREDVHSVPLSRRSSVSFGSSREGDVEAWEGFVDDSDDDDKSSPIRPGMYPNPPPVSRTQLDILGSNLDAACVQDTAEDERVKEGLEQSLISTLSSSRSSSAAYSASTHSSLRDLRLSFPDPLTSSKDNLPLSRPATPPNEVTPTSVEPRDTATATPPKPEPEPGTGIPPPEIPQASKCDIIDIVLYGSSPTSKWTLLEQLLRKAAGFTHRTLTSTLPSEDAAHFIFKPRSEAVQPNGIAVYDCTQGGAIHFTSSDPDRPSLAVVFLPSDSLRVLPEHTFYLPIFVDVDSADVVAHDASVRSSAERAWRMLPVPPGKTLCLGNGPTSILSSSELENVEPFRAHRALQRLLLPAKKQPSKTFADHLSSVPAVTFFALVSIVMSFAINTIFRPPEPTPVFRTQVASPTWGTTTTQLNSSTAVQATPISQQGTALIASSLKDFALSIINPHSTALSVTSQSSLLMSVSQPLTSKAKTRKEAQPPVYTAKISPSTDIILRPVPTPPSVFTKSTVAPSMTNKEDRMAPSGSAVSIRLIDSVPEVFETTVKAALGAVHSDLKELVDAMDDLMRAIQDQTKKAMTKSADTAHSIQDHVNYRNERARGKAREIRDKSEKLIQSAGEQLMETTWSMKTRGEQFVTLAQEHIKDRTSVAKEKAHGFREKIVKSDAWQTYVAGHDEWAKKVIDKKAAKREYKKWVKSLKGPKMKCRKESRRACMSHLMWG
ncbi:hypothetical protein JOM56_001452 [Amanita muscaria]